MSCKQAVFPVPVAERMMWTLSDADLVQQAALYPMPLVTMLNEKRLARKAAAQWRRFTVQKRQLQQFQLIRNMKDVAHNEEFTANLFGQLTPVLDQVTHAAQQIEGLVDEFQEASSAQQMSTLMASEPMQQLGQRMCQLFESDAELRGAFESWLKQESSIEEVLETVCHRDHVHGVLDALRHAND